VSVLWQVRHSKRTTPVSVVTILKEPPAQFGQTNLIGCSLVVGKGTWDARPACQGDKGTTQGVKPLLRAASGKSVA
jgi:hypothetical protein